MGTFDISDCKIPCHWHPEMICQNGKDCGECEHQPADDDKKNGKAPPRHIVWDRGEYGTFPECPACGEMPYSYERCIFCGQKFLPDETAEEMKKPAEEVREDCPLCGGKNTMVGIRARCNGHFHGKCEKCGCQIME